MNDKQNMVYTYNGKYYIVLKRTHATIRINLEDIMLSETVQSKKDKCSMISLT
jgi:hypothetical protein